MTVDTPEGLEVLRISGVSISRGSCEDWRAMACGFCANNLHNSENEEIKLHFSRGHQRKHGHQVGCVETEEILCCRHLHA
jgi:hypothetical protein